MYAPEATSTCAGGSYGAAAASAFGAHCRRSTAVAGVDSAEEAEALLWQGMKPHAEADVLDMHSPDELPSGLCCQAFSF